VVCPVMCEPVSDAKFPINGKINGNVRENRCGLAKLPKFMHEFQHFRSNFPIVERREICSPNWEAAAGSLPADGKRHL
jgi:hypothetical protein